jgi:hypothetical protein
MTPAERALLIAIGRVLYQQTGDYDLGAALHDVENEQPPEDNIERIGQSIRILSINAPKEPEKDTQPAEATPQIDDQKKSVVAGNSRPS